MSFVLQPSPHERHRFCPSYSYWCPEDGCKKLQRIKRRMRANSAPMMDDRDFQRRPHRCCDCPRDPEGPDGCCRLRKSAAASGPGQSGRLDPVLSAAPLHRAPPVRLGGSSSDRRERRRRNGKGRVDLAISASALKRPNSTSRAAKALPLSSDSHGSARAAGDSAGS